MYKGLSPSYSLLQDKVQNGAHFSRTKFRVDEVLRGPVEPFGFSLNSSSPNIEVMKLFVGRAEPLRGVGCDDIKFYGRRS